ncbi:MAG TPA: Hpt domain-containing protein [Campylobacterales bacterium]|nr:Hpt domain-containing protein [Campylobacterales bacterium]
MYYGYNNNKQIIMADSEFIKLLGYEVFSEISKNSINKNIKFENSKVYIQLENKSIKANYTETIFFTEKDNITIVKLSNIIETKGSVSKVQLNYEPIYLDVEKLSKEIGLSVDDYKLYLDSFIDQSIIDEEKLFAGDDKAIKNLSNLALTLKIPNINILLLKIKKLPTEDRIHYIDEYYTKLALLTTKEPLNYKPNSILENDNLPKEEAPLDSKFTELVSNIEEDDDMILDLLDTPSTSSSPSPKITAKKVEEKKEDKDLLDLDLMDLDFNLEDELSPIEDEPIKKNIPSNKNEDTDKIILENAPALPIHYNPKIAADELNLPVVLIEEFVEDFIEQAHHDKDHLLASYYQKDMDNIHELGHKLKGAASNLRINELADVLEEIQFCTEHSKLKSLFIKYWGLFISLEKYMQQPKQL